MCGRYVRRSDKQKIAEAFKVSGGLEELQLEPDEDVRPTTVQPIVRANRETGERDLVMARWGFVPGWQKAGERLPGNLFNARSEGVERAAMWSRAFAQHRCLVPADGFFEWQKIWKKNNPKFAFRLKSGEPFAFAGLWGAWKNPGSGEWLQSFTILTTDPNAVVEPVHGRMPVIVEPRDYGRWLSREAGVGLPVDLLRPLAAEEMVAEAVVEAAQDGGDEPDSL